MNKISIIEKKDKSGEPVLTIKGEMTIYTAAELCRAMLSKIENSGNLNFDLCEISAIDTAGLQLLLAARRENKTKKQNIIFSNPSEEVTRISSLYGITL
jgi:anti-sigma B factor antagonist